MKLYLVISGKKKPLENYSPYETRQFLIKVLTVKEWAKSERHEKFYYSVQVYN